MVEDKGLTLGCTSSYTVDKSRPVILMRLPVGKLNLGKIFLNSRSKSMTYVLHLSSQPSFYTWININPRLPRFTAIAQLTTIVA